MICQAQHFCSPQDGRALRHEPQWTGSGHFCQALSSGGCSGHGAGSCLANLRSWSGFSWRIWWVYHSLPGQKGDVCLWASVLRASPKDSRKAAAAVSRRAEWKAQIDGMVSSRPGRDTLWPCSCHHMARCCGQSEMPARATLPPNPGRLKQVHPLLFSSIISPKVTSHKWTLIIEPVWLLILLRPHFPAGTWGEIFCPRFSQAEMKLAQTGCGSAGSYFFTYLFLLYLGHSKLWNWCAKRQAQIQSFRLLLPEPASLSSGVFFPPKNIFSSIHTVKKKIKNDCPKLEADTVGWLKVPQL